MTIALLLPVTFQFDDPVQTVVYMHLVVATTTRHRVSTGRAEQDVPPVQPEQSVVTYRSVQEIVSCVADELVCTPIPGQVDGVRACRVGSDQALDVRK